MSVLVERSMGDLNNEKVYPLFQKGAIVQPQLKKRISQDDLKTTNAQPISNNAPKDTSTRKLMKSQSAKSTGSIQIPAPDTLSTDRTSTGHGELLEVDPNNGRRKRRKTALTAVAPATKDAETVPQAPMGTLFSSGGIFEAAPAIAASDDMVATPPYSGTTEGVIPGTEIAGRMSGHALLVGNESQATYVSPYSTTDVKKDEAKPRKILQFNPKTGTIGSPPAKKIQTPAASNSKKTTTSRGRPPKSKLVTIRYGQGQSLPSSVGPKIDEIMNSTKSIVPMENVDSTKPKAAVKRSPPKPAKSTHPFFMGKVGAKAQSPSNPAQPNDTVGPTHPKEHSSQGRIRPASCGRSGSPSKALVSFSGFGSTTKTTKFPGAVEPAWPGKDMVHVRGLGDNLEYSRQPLPLASLIELRGTKSKYQAVRILEGEGILGNLAKDLCIPHMVESIQEINADEFPPTPDCLRIPVKHLESGVNIQKRIRKELHTRLPAPDTLAQSSSEDDIQQSLRNQPWVHPAILKTYNSLSTSLSAFDKGLCESQAWIHKYSPRLASDILQAEREITVLKTWLQSLTIKAVEAGLGNVNGTSTIRRPGTKSESGGKRRRKSKKLDGFVVSSDEEVYDMDELSEPDDDNSPFGGQAQQMRTIVRTCDLSKDTARSSNAIVISGPHGCGKTAAVYAVAKELDFEVFEINAGGKRSGKDIVDKVGDMTRNHQVQRVFGPAQVDGPGDEDKRRIDEALANDLKSGRQGTMNSFFTTQPTPKPKPKSETEMKPTEPILRASMTQSQVTLDGARPKVAARAQKQSLILIEEADILYKEDTQFWSTIIEMIGTSRRPIVITCNDEAALPLAALSLHAIIRMSAPPVNLAVDYMLLVAAREGHLIQRDAVQTLYESRNMDLRASLVDLDFWCQFAVGDQKNGLGWYLPRWPKGNDVDKYGNILRVVSEGTYKAGMGWLSQDILESEMHHLEIEEETLHEAHNSLNLDVGNWQESLNMTAWARTMQSQIRDKSESRAALQAYDEFIEAMSCADLCSGGLFASDNQLTIDATLPELTTKVHLDDTLAYKLLDASAVVNYDTLGYDISYWLKSRSRSYLQVEQHVKMNAEVPKQLSRPDEADIIRLIRKKATTPDLSLRRYDFSVAFDPISEPEKNTIYNNGQLEASVFDRTMKIVVEDMAPYVRSIVDYDARLQAERAKLSNLISEGGRKGKRMRTTRAAMSALEGGARSTTRKEKYFDEKLNPHFVMKTGMQSWTDAARSELSACQSRRPSNASLVEAKTDSEKDEVMDDQ